MRRPGLLAGLAALAAACSDTTTTGINQLNLDRPVDVAFACYGPMRTAGGAAKDLVTTAQPTFACESLSPQQEVNAKPAPGQETIDGITPAPVWYAFILQSSSGTVALAQWDPKPADDMTGGVSNLNGEFKVLDADPLTPGKNALSIGEDPVAIITDKAGCFEVTANAGSCDLSELDVNTALNGVSADGTPAKASKVRIERVAVHNRNGAPILAKPAAMVAEPGTTVVGQSCPVDGAGNTVATGKVYIAYPSCHLVAEVDTSDGSIVSAIGFDATGVATILSGAALDGVTCPTECTSAGGAIVPPSSMDLAPRPVALSFELDTRVDDSKPAATSRLAIGAERSHSITVVDLEPDPASPQSFAPKTLFQVPLEDKAGTLGLTAVALSPQIGMGGDFTDMTSPLGDVNTRGGQAQFVYAVASDGTVRVADVLALKRECDTQIDGRFLQKFTDIVADPPRLACLPIGDPTLPRLSGARSPGIELPDHSVPTSVTIVKGPATPPADSMGAPRQASPGVLVGYFAIVTSTTGATYVVNIDDDYAPDVFNSSAPTGTAPVLIIPHQLRDSFIHRDANPLSTDNSGLLCKATDPAASIGSTFAGGPRVGAPPSQNIPTNTLTGVLNAALPKFQQLECTGKDAVDGVPVSELEFGAPLRSTDPLVPGRNTVYPDLKTVLNETWTLTYEGTLSNDSVLVSIDGPPIREATIKVDSTGMRIEDSSEPFCEMGVEPGDIVDFRGCNPTNLDRDCPANYTCYVHPKSSVPVGACILKSEAPRLADACREFLSTLRRYTVGRSATSNAVDAGRLVLLERKHELSTTPVDGCISDDQCKQLAQLADKINDSADPYIEPQPPDVHGTTWSCQTDPLREPINSDPTRNKRCVLTCTGDPMPDPNAPDDPRHAKGCTNGTICRLPLGSTEGVCMEGIEPPQACVNGPQRFDVRAAEAFAVIGGTSGYVHPFIKKNGVCVRDPAAEPVQIGRIPLDPLKAPACDLTADPITGLRKDGTFDANPCTVTVPHAEVVPNRLPTATDPCAVDPKEPEVLVSRMAPAVKFRNRAMTLTLVDPYYPGDQLCPLDRAGNLGNIPFAVTGYQLQFTQKGGYAPFTLPLIGQVYTVKVVRGPSESIWVIDDGDFLATSITQASTRGRVFRVESVPPKMSDESIVVNVLE